jgi:hypothetical protein
VVGTVILFGFLIIALSLYQVQVVPQENAEIEFQHFEETRNDLVEVRAGILQAGSIDRPQYRTVRLGTTYSTRLFTINPPAPAGTIRTTESYPITISNGTDTETIPTRFLQYRPGYNEIDRSSTWYDASVLYLNATENGGGIAVIEDQELVDDDGGVRIVALQNEFRRSGTGRVTLELRPAEAVTGSIPEGDVNVTIPTRLSGDEYWDDADIPAATYGGVTSDANGDGVHNLTLETTSDNLTVDTVGIQETAEAPTQNANGALGGGSGEGSGDGDSSNSGGGFDQLIASVQTGNGANSGKPDTVTIDSFSIGSSSDIVFTATESGNSVTQTVSGPSGSNIELDLGGVGSNTFPVQVTANINGGECLETTFSQGDSAKQLNDWTTC